MQVTTLSSLEAQKFDPYNKPEWFETRFVAPIYLDQNKKKYDIGMEKIDIHCSWYNISPQYNNKEIEYKVGTSVYKTITFTSGSYGYNDTSYYIKQRLIDEWDFLEENDTDERPISIEFNLTTLRCTINHEEGYSIKFNKEFGDIRGLEEGEYK